MDFDGNRFNSRRMRLRRRTRNTEDGDGHNLSDHPPQMEELHDTYETVACFVMDRDETHPLVIELMYIEINSYSTHTHIHIQYPLYYDNRSTIGFVQSNTYSSSSSAPLPTSPNVSTGVTPAHLSFTLAEMSETDEEGESDWL